MLMRAVRFIRFPWTNVELIGVYLRNRPTDRLRLFRDKAAAVNAINATLIHQILFQSMNAEKSLEIRHEFEYAAQLLSENSVFWSKLKSASAQLSQSTYPHFINYPERCRLYAKNGYKNADMYFVCVRCRALFCIPGFFLALASRDLRQIRCEQFKREPTQAEYPIAEHIPVAHCSYDFIFSIFALLQDTFFVFVQCPFRRLNFRMIFYWSLRGFETILFRFLVYVRLHFWNNTNCECAPLHKWSV